LAASGFVGGLWAAAVVLAQVPKVADSPGGTTAQQLVDRFGDAASKATKSSASRPAALHRAPAKSSIKARVEMNGDRANRANLIQQWIHQGQPVVRAELLFVRNVCHLSQEQLRRIDRNAANVLSDVVTSMVDGQAQSRIVAASGSETASHDGIQLLQVGLSDLLKRELSPERWERYQAESDKRLACRKSTALEYLVNVLDHELFLSDHQRARIRESLSSRWQDRWSMYLEYVLYGNRFFPNDIDPLVSSALDETQRKVWQGCQRVRVGWGFGGVLGGFSNDPDALEEELGEARKAEPAKHRIEKRPAAKGLAP
jgi:hypothetical protein